MRKLLFLAAMSAIALTGCTSDEDYNGGDSQQVLRFDAPAMRQTRANVMGEITGVQYDAREHFMVYAKYYKGDFASWTAADVKDYFNATGDTRTKAIPANTGQHRPHTIGPTMSTTWLLRHILLRTWTLKTTHSLLNIPRRVFK